MFLSKLSCIENVDIVKEFAEEFKLVFGEFLESRDAFEHL